MKCLLTSLTCSPDIFTNPVPTNFLFYMVKEVFEYIEKNKICRINWAKKYLLQPVNNFKQNFVKSRRYRIRENMSWARYTTLTLHVLKLERKKKSLKLIENWILPSSCHCYVVGNPLHQPSNAMLGLFSFLGWICTFINFLVFRVRR